MARSPRIGWMKSISITQARRKLGELVRTPETVELTHRGTPVGTLRVYAEAHYDRDKAREAARRIREIGLKYKPSKKHGGTQALRDLRDDGE